MLGSDGSSGSRFQWGLASFFVLWSYITLAQGVGRDMVVHSDGKEESRSCPSCVKLRVLVSEFVRIAGSDDFVEGYGVVYSHTILTVIEPAALSGRKLTIEHTAVPAGGSIWRSVGAEAIIELSPVGLQSPTVIIPAGEVDIRKQDDS